ncbi:histidine kinase dimerization/phospho-acceptor domain-containing protein [Clostridium sp.]|uniref:HAMP domain-containing sensor histidine kinase n=1 Tax=Clostridium sp. TaxID=1506 RepID=UPI003217B5D0
MKIRFKFIAWLSAILVVFGVIFNLSIRYILIFRMETSINNALKQVMYSTREAIKYRLLASDLEYKEDSLIKEGSNLTKYISSNFQCLIEMRDTSGNVIMKNIGENFDEVLDSGSKSANEGDAVVNLKYTDNTLYGVLSYPIFINGYNLGTLNVIKDYKEIYSENNITLMFITLIEIVTFLLIFILSFFIISKVTKPIIKLTDGVKRVGDGDYDFSIKLVGNDEVAVLSKEFISMKDKIREQISTIRSEKEKVEILEKARKGFFDNVTHEIKTPLTAISGYAEMLRDEMIQDEAFNKRAIDRIYLESERLHNLILDLIEVSKGLSYTKEEVREIDIGNLLIEICEDMGIKAEKYSIEIISDVSYGEILGQSNRIRELIINIVDNGIKYSKPYENIYVRGNILEENYILEVESISGIIPSQVYDYIFDPFIKSNRYTDGESRGLGLYLCNEIVKDHNGNIKVINGERVIVKVSLPIKLEN